ALDIADHAAVIAFCRKHDIDLVVVGPEGPLVAGIVDDLAKAGILAFGPSALAARLEGSKGFVKDLCAEYNIPTAAYGRFSSKADALDYLRIRGVPIVIKADGLAAGKGVTVAMTMNDATAAVEEIFAGKFGEAGSEVVIEEFLEGEEASFFVLADGKDTLALVTAQDHKRAYDGDTGPNTGGMGAYSPAPVMTDELIARTMSEIIQPTIRAMNDRGCPYQGVLYAGLMVTDQGPKLIEYNVRFGDPECQVLMMRLKSDCLALLTACASGALAGRKVEWSADPALTVVMAAKGYPGPYEKGSHIRNLQSAASEGVEIFHAGTAIRNGDLIATGGRVLNVTARGADVEQAAARAYRAIEKIDWPEGFYRKDIGWRAITGERKVS
ncbi:MAG: phosphoribosylamine--glycine ligase, partial [Fimbriimonadaceae bacterium]|nr:phosphoribosylamine--glycine ligase [Alphaproteobacteria bacterium]